jgi:hypothetical protein
MSKQGSRFSNRSRSRISLTRSSRGETGGIKLVSLPAKPAPVPMGMHGAIATYYKLADESFTPNASTLNYVVAATPGCLAGTLGRPLAVRNIPVAEGHLQVEAVGELEVDDGVLVICRIRVVAHLKADGRIAKQPSRSPPPVHSGVPVYRSLHQAIEVTTELDFQPTNHI